MSDFAFCVSSIVCRVIVVVLRKVEIDFNVWFNVVAMSLPQVYM